MYSDPFLYDEFKQHTIRIMETQEGSGGYYAVMDVLQAFFKSTRKCHQLSQEIQDCAYHCQHVVDPSQDDDLVLCVLDDDLKDFLLRNKHATRIPAHLRNEFVYDFMRYEKPHDHRATVRQQRRFRTSALVNQRHKRMAPFTEEEALQHTHMLKNLAQTYQVIGDDRPLLKKRLLIHIENQERILEARMPQPPLYQDDTSGIVRVSARIRQKRRHLSDDTIHDIRQEVGALASDYHFQTFGIRPMRYLGWVAGEQRPINRYTEKTAQQTIDKAIQDVLNN